MSGKASSEHVASISIDFEPLVVTRDVSQTSGPSAFAPPQ